MRKLMYLFVFPLFLMLQFGIAAEAGSAKKKPVTKDKLTSQ